MSEAPPRQINLSFGLITLGVVSVLALLLVWRVLAQPTSSSASQTSPQIQTEAFPISAPSVERLVASLSEINPGRTDRLLFAAPQLPSTGAQRIALLETSLAVLREEAAYIRYASLGDFADILIAFGDGVDALESAESHWCQASSLADLTRLNEDQLIPYLLRSLSSDDEAFEWSVQFFNRALLAARNGRVRPTRHGSRTQQDEAVVQFYGRQLGVERIPVALSVAAFSHSEGRDFATMRDAIEGVDVCELGDAFIDLSDRLPNDVKGRVMAELAPEIFYGNTPYVLYLLRGYFFIG